MFSVKFQFFTSLLIFYFCTYAKADDYEYFDKVDKYYKFHRNPTTWFKARDVCLKENGILAMPRNAEEMNVLKNYFIDNHPESTLNGVVNKDFIFLGFHNHFSDDEYVSLQGEPLQKYFHKWEKGQPQRNTNEKCGSMKINGLLHDFLCSVPGVFMCEKPGKNQNQLNRYYAFDSEYKCYSDMDLCYKLHLTPKKWYDARLICHMEGGRLAIIRSKKIEKILINLFNDPENNVPFLTYDQHVLIGIHDLYEEGKFVTTEEKLLSSYNYVNWGPGEPNSAGGSENCGSMKRNGQINDYSCSIPALFACERPNPANFLDLRSLSN